jgi:hypothetical protein
LMLIEITTKGFVAEPVLWQTSTFWPAVDDCFVDDLFECFVFVDECGCADECVCTDACVCTEACAELDDFTCACDFAFTCAFAFP